MKKIISLFLTLLMILPLATSFASAEETDLQYNYINVLVDDPVTDTKIYNTPIKVMGSTSRELPYVEFTDRTDEFNIDVVWYSWLTWDEIGEDEFDCQIGDMLCTELDKDAIVKNGQKYCYRVTLTTKDATAYFEFWDGVLFVNDIKINEYENYDYNYYGTELYVAVPAGVKKEAASGGLLDTDYFKNGIEKGVVSYMTCNVDTGAECDTWMDLYYDIPENIHNYILMSNEKWDEGTLNDYYESLGLVDAGIAIQIDLSLDGTKWLSNELTWDIDETGYSSYLSYTTSKNEKMQDYRIIWFNTSDYYLYSFLKPALKTTWNFDYDYEVCWFDKENYSLYVRLRYGIKQQREGEETEYKFGDWSDVAIVGKNTNQPILTKPTKLDAPIIDDVTVKPEQGSGTEIKFNHIVPQSINEADLYYSIFGEGEVGSIAGQIKINNGEWIDWHITNGGWHTEGYRNMYILSTQYDIKESDDITIRVRYEGYPYYSDWSNEITVKGKRTYIFTTKPDSISLTNGEEGTFTWAFNETPDKVMLQQYNDSFEWVDIADITLVNSYSIAYKEEYKDSSKYYRIVATFGDVQIYSDFNIGWDHNIQWIKLPADAKLQNGTPYTVEWEFTDVPDYNKLYIYNEDSSEWEEVGNITSPYDFSGESDTSKLYRISGYFSKKDETLYWDFNITWGNFSFEIQPIDKTAQIGTEITVNWATSFVPEKTEVFVKNATGEWIFFKELDESERFNSYCPFYNDAEPTSSTYKVRVWNKGLSYDSNEFTLTWNYKKGDFDYDQQVTVADALAALRIAAKLVQEDKASVVIGDIDNDQHVTVADALAILRVAAKIVSEDTLG